MSEKKNTTPLTMREKLTIRIFCMIIRVINYSWFRLEHNTEMEKLVKDLEQIK